ncbi:MAG: hypothetical protein ABL999_01325 [Pyrinomonadaceae bacterium]
MFASGSYGQEFTLTTSASNITASRAMIDSPGLAGNPNAIIVAVPTGNTAALNPHPIGAWYYNGKWSIFNTDHAGMPVGCTYKLKIFAQPGPNQFLHVVTKYTLTDEGSLIDEPALNNNPNAQVEIFQNHAPDNRTYNLNRYETKVEYAPAAGKWIIKNINGRRMELNMSYNVVVSAGGAAVSDTRPAVVATPAPIASIPDVNAEAEAATALMLPAVPPQGEETSIPVVFDSLNDFPKKGLPSAAPLPFGNLDHAAAIMAQQILRSDAKSLPVLLTALQASGFTVIDKNGKVLLRPANGKGQGLSIYDFEAVGSLKIDRTQIKFPLETIAAMITKKVPEIPARQFGELMLRDLRASAERNDDPYLRFWARLIIELGNVPGNRIDMMDVPVSRVEFNILQTTLMLRRLQGVFHRLNNKTGTLTGPDLRRIGFMPAAFRLEQPVFRLTSHSVTQNPCNLTGDQALILDGAAIQLSTWNGAIVGSFNRPGLNAGIQIANAALAWGKLAASVTMLRGTIHVQEGPLIRTLNSDTSKLSNRRLLVGRFWSEVGDVEALNCLRPTLNLMTGLDFNLPTGGPLGDVAAEWRFKGDNDTRVNDAATRNTDAFVDFEIDKADRAKGNNPDPQKQVTDDLGLTKMWLVGKPKVPAILSGPIDVPKKAEVYVTLTLKSAKDFKQNVIDFSGFVIGASQSVSATGVDPIAFTTALIGAGAEVGYRTPFTAARAVVPVIDHEQCQGGWTGTVTYTVVDSSKSKVNRGPSSTGMQQITGGYESSDRTLIQSGTISIEGGLGKNSPASAQATEVLNLDGLTTGRVLCSRKEGFRPFTVRETITDNGEGSASGLIDVQIMLRENDYQISFKPMSMAGKVTRVASGSMPGNCAGKKGGSTNSTYDTTYGLNDRAIATGRYGPDRNKLSGSYTYSAIPTVTVTINWNLKRCK